MRSLPRGAQAQTSLVIDQAAGVLDEVNAASGTRWALLGRLTGGYQSGAYLLRDRDGARAVLKFTDDPAWAPTVLAAAPVVAMARASGWPTPAWLLVGQTSSGLPFQVQEFIHGTTQELVTHGWLDLVLPVVSKQEGLGREGMREWSRYDYDVVFRPRSPNREAVSASGEAGARLTDVVAHATHHHQGVVLPDGDLVHGDMNPENVLIGEHGVAGLIDVETLGRGTRLHDVSTLMLYAALWGDHDVQERLTAAARSIAASGWLEVTLSAVAIALHAIGTRHWPTNDLAAMCDAAATVIETLTKGPVPTSTP